MFAPQLVVPRVKRLILFVGDLGGRHLETFGDGYRMYRTFVGIFLPAFRSHIERTWPDVYQLNPNGVFLLGNTMQTDMEQEQTKQNTPPTEHIIYGVYLQIGL